MPFNLTIMTNHALLTLSTLLTLTTFTHAEFTGALTTTISTAGFVITEYYTTISTLTFSLGQLTIIGTTTTCPPGFLSGFIGPPPTNEPACLFCPTGFWYDRTDCEPQNFDNDASYSGPASFTPTPTLGGAASTFVYGQPNTISETFTQPDIRTTMTTSITATGGGPYSLVEYSAIVPSVSGYAIHMPDLAFYPETTITTGGFTISMREQLSSLTIPYGGPATTEKGVVKYSVNLPMGYFLAKVETATATATSSGSDMATGTTVVPNQGAAARLGVSSLAVSALLGCVWVILVVAL